MTDKFQIDQIKERTDIVETIGHYVKLQKKGQNFLGLCPFHREKSPSFTVSPEKNLWRCFGCGESGNVFGFLMKIENINFFDSLKILAGKAGITLEDSAYHRTAGPQKDNTYLYEILAVASVFYTDNSGQQKAADYIKKRGLRPEICKEFEIGYSGQKGALYSHLSSKYSDQQLLESGLFVDTMKGVVERFVDRLMFPIVDLQERIVAFGGRTLGEDQAKYINSPETEIYHKSNYLYGLNVAKKHLREPGLILVEGYMDTVALHQVGIKNAVASLGTSFTVQQAKLVARYTDRVFFCFDNDDAGKKATVKSYDIIQDSELQVKVIKLGDVKDPDEYVSKYGKDKFEIEKEQGIPIIKYMMINLIEQYASLNNLDKLSIEDKGRIVKDFRAIIDNKSDIVKQEYIKELAQLLSLDYEALKNSFYNFSAVNLQRKSFENTGSKINKAQKAENDILSILINDLSLRKEFSDKILVTNFEDENNRKIYQLLMDKMEEKADVLITEIEDKVIVNKVIELSMYEHIIKNKEHLIAQIKSINSRVLQQKKDFLKTEIKRFEKMSDSDKLQREKYEQNIIELEKITRNS